MSKARWVTFDCFGTLVDWHSGFGAALRPLFGSRTAEVLEAYHVFERELEGRRPHQLYKDVLIDALSLAAAKVGVPLTSEGAQRLPQAWAALPVFPDVEEMLAELRDRGLRLAVLTNCDDDLFAMTQSNFRQPFELVVTAQQVGAYKPSLAHFETFAQVTGVAPGNWVHVACSCFHDIAPAHALGLPRVWLDRDNSGDDAAVASVRISSAAPVCAAVQGLLDGAKA